MISALTEEEAYFIDNFIVASKRERLRFELGKTKETRRRAIDRFSHDARKLLDEKYIRPVEIARGALCDADGSAVRIEGEVYALSLYGNCDHMTLPFADAIEKFMGLGPYILINANRGFAFIETESGCKEHEYLFLSKQKTVNND